MRNFQEQVKKEFCYQKLFWPCTVWINCSSDLKNFANSQPSASIFKSFSRSLEQFFLTVGQNNFGNKIPFFIRAQWCCHQKKVGFSNFSERIILKKIQSFRGNLKLKRKKEPDLTILDGDFYPGSSVPNMISSTQICHPVLV